jgi:flagellar biosynthetic protein FliR
MFEIDSALMSGWVSSALWPFFRIGGFLMVAPIFGTQLITARIRIILALLLTLILVPNLPEMPIIDSLSVSTYVLVAQQLLIGFAMGFSMQLLLQVFVVAGQIAAMHMGLGFASMVDPTNGINSTVMSSFYLMLVTLVFVSANGHLAMIEIIAESFYTLPVGGAFLSNNSLWDLVGSASWMFASALLLALPIIGAMLVINLSLGVVTRAAPQLNIFSIGFPSMMVLGLFIVLFSMGGFLPLIDQFTRQALDQMAFLAK